MAQHHDRLTLAEQPVSTQFRLKDLDARRDQVYAGAYSLVDQVPRPLMADAALPLDELIPLLPKPVMFAGQGAHVYWDQILSRMGRDAELAPELPVGGSVAVLGLSLIHI